MSLTVLGQKEASYWYFGDKVGFDFSKNSFKTLTNGARIIGLGSSAMSDKTSGKLLLYADGSGIFDSQHQRMPDGNFITSPSDPIDSTTRWLDFEQQTLIIPVPAREFCYYVFHTDAPNYPYTDTTYLRYTMIDMRLRNGRGGVIEKMDKNTFLAKEVFRLTAVPHSNGKDYWLITHSYDNSDFLIFPVTSQGIGTPLVQTIGSIHLRGIRFGQLKPSPNGKKIAAAMFGGQYDHADLFDFNATTGQLSNPIDLGRLRSVGGISFSPDNSKLYVACLGSDANGQVNYDIIRQYDLTDESPQSIINSGQSIVKDNPFTNINQGRTEGRYSYDNLTYTELGMQLGIDGKLYWINLRSSSDDLQKAELTVIHYPNKRGFACDINIVNFNFPGVYDDPDGYPSDGLPNFIQSYFNGISSDSSTGDCQTGSVNVSLYPNPCLEIVRVRSANSCISYYNIELVNMLGQKLQSVSYLAIGSEINVSSLPSGIYFMSITTNTHEQFTKKLIINR
ncbi:T9SS type A sorting domain-containing protein [Xanthocytophaga flava]|uniref:T9SS type A sorting domain-containing protein n=1 Tax=Xanthocytophaga flava TaxID=3048013 RepID=UPI0028D52250|nr:T9SS type A sorting domain-containing protein [Xanthocytophaga flavus]MDJ1469230.1 T9SS type A sorting domain-containing protein [Xanthocytophaga flavus]